MENKQIGIIGSGGQAREVVEYLADEEITPSFYAINPEYIEDGAVNKVDILNPTDFEKITPVVAAIGSPDVRRKLVGEWAGENFATVISEHAYVGDSVEIGKGSIVAPRAVITANVQIGEHAIINVGATISHDCTFGDFVTVGPGAHIAGDVELGNGVFVGIGAIVSNGLKISDGVVVGAGAVVVKDVLQENSVVVGIPAETIRVNEGWLGEV